MKSFPAPHPPAHPGQFCTASPPPLPVVLVFSLQDIQRRDSSSVCLSARPPSPHTPPSEAVQSLHHLSPLSCAEIPAFACQAGALRAGGERSCRPCLRLSSLVTSLGRATFDRPLGRRRAGGESSPRLHLSSPTQPAPVLEASHTQAGRQAGSERDARRRHQGRLARRHYQGMKETSTREGGGGGSPTSQCARQRCDRHHCSRVRPSLEAAGATGCRPLSAGRHHCRHSGDTATSPLLNPLPLSERPVRQSINQFFR